MKLNYALTFVLALGTLVANAQDKNKLRDNVAHQTMMTVSGHQSQQEAIANFAKSYELDENSTFQEYRTTTDKLGNTHSRYQQYFNGIKVQFGVMIVHNKQGSVSLINGELYSPKTINTVPSLSKEVGLQRAIEHTNANAYLWEDASQAALMGYSKPVGELVIFPDVNKGIVHLAYMYDVYSTSPISRNEVYVDAHSGDILFKNPIIKHADRLISNNEISAKAKEFENTLNSALVEGTADTRYSGTRPIETTSEGSEFILLDTTRGDGIVTYNCEGFNAYQDLHFSDNDNAWTAAEYDNDEKDNGALDAHWGAEVTYDFWQDIFNRNSFDDEGAQIISYVHYDDADEPLFLDTGYDNAFWNGSVMTYGDGNTFDILTAADVCGHEIGHAVCTFTADLAYQNQSGGMNEGYSDIWGACVEHFGRTGSIDGAIDPNVWLIGEDLNSPPLRSMSDPNSRNDPDTYLGDNWVSTGDEGTCVPDATTNDYCGVHTNSGVLNHWFYILTEGAADTNNAPTPDTYDVAGIGMVKSAEIAYLAERDYLTPNATYFDARNATIAVASSIYCANSPEVISVTNAWYAVNVGEEFAEAADDVSLMSITNNTEVGCDAGTFSPQIVVSNGGTNMLGDVDISFSVNGAATTTVTETVNLGTCESTTLTLDIGSLTRGANILNVDVTTTNDGRPENNTGTVLVVVNDAAEIDVVNTFDTVEESLISYNDGVISSLWERGVAQGTLLSDAVAGGSDVYGTNLDGNHPDGTIAYLVSQCYDLSSVENAVLKFDMAFDLEENWDIMYMQYTTDGGSTWQTLGTASDANWYNNDRLPDGTDCFNCIGSQWTGEGEDAHSGGGLNATMHEYSYSLSAFDNDGSAETSMVFRFVFQSDAAVNEEGVIVDNFVVEADQIVLATTNNEFKGLSIYPNPTNTIVNISGQDLKDAKVSVIDLSGRVISNNASVFNGNVLQVNMEQLASGSYFLVIENENYRSVKQVIRK